MSKRKYEIDMTQGSLIKNIIRFAVPLMLANMLQLFYNAADMIVVGMFRGDNAVASIGTTGSLTALLINMFIGLSLGTSVIVSRKFGAQDHEGVHRAVHTTAILSVVTGLMSAAAGEIFSRPFLVMMGTPEGEVLEGAVLYMKILFIGTPGTIVYNFGSAILRAVGDTKRPLYILTISGIANVLLNLVLVIFFGMGVEGVAIATAVSKYIAAFMVVWALIKADGSYRLVLKEMRFYKDELKQILRIGIPAGCQSSMFNLSNTVVQSGINSFGAMAMAGSAAASNIENFIYNAMVAFYQAVLTSVGQNYGAKNHKRINQSIVISVVCVTVVGVVMGLLIFIFSKPLLSLYISEGNEAMAFGMTRLKIIGLTYVICGIMDVLVGAIRGFGYSTITVIYSLLGTVVFRIFWILVVLPLHKTPEILFSAWPISWVMLTLCNFVTLIIIKKIASKKISEM